MSQRTLILATHNRDKAQELSQLFADLPIDKVVCAADLAGAPDVEETGSTLEENALLKAREMAFHFDTMCVADDTGLEVDALEGAPGVRSARYAGEDASYQDNCRKLAARMEGVPRPKRTARFRTVMALVDPGGTPAPVEQLVEGALEGQILEEARGRGGFGYDPLFYVPELRSTLAELSLEEKNRMSHRARAAEKMLDVLKTYLGGDAPS